MLERCPILEIKFIKKNDPLKDKYQRVSFDSKHDIMFSKFENSAPLTYFEISEDRPCMNRKDTFSTDQTTINLKFFQR